ncbi:MAG: hypothetical protein ACFB2X_09600 [Rivularia sp. (in: cyanobacteria)]
MSDITFSDRFFVKLIDDISANNTLKFTEQQLFYLFNQRLIKNLPSTVTEFIFIYLGLFVIIIGILSSRQTSGLFITAFGVWMVLSGMAIQDYQKKKKVKNFIVTPEQFRVYLNNWQSVNPIDGILSLSQQKSLPNSINSDITAYSFDRVVVSDSAEIANLLIANNFHFENNSAVLSIDGYPENIFDMVMQMLRRNDNLKVYVLHDASPSGVSVVNTLSNNSDWFSNSNVTIYDLGLLPRQIVNNHNPNFFTQISEDSAREAQELAFEIKQDLTKEEIAWLEAGKFVELESFTPQKLLRVISQGISKSRQAHSNGDTSTFGDYGASGDDGGSFDDCDVTIYTDDCFG